MALMPEYPIRNFEDLQRAISMAQHDPAAARAIRAILMTVYYQQGRQDHLLIDMKNLKDLQKVAAEEGFEFGIETTDPYGRRIIHRPPKAIAPVEKKPMAPAKPQAAPPAGVNFTSHQRVGDEARDAYLEHLHAMFTGGYIDQAEHSARVDALMLAHTREEMEFLTQDLPQLKAKELVPPAPPSGISRYTDKISWPLVSLISGFFSILNAFDGSLAAATAMLFISLAAAAMFFAHRG
jgi:hypothetical protein